MSDRVDCVRDWVSYVSWWMNWVSKWVCCLVDRVATDIVMRQMLSWVDCSWLDMCLMVDTVVM